MNDQAPPNRRDGENSQRGDERPRPSEPDSRRAGLIGLLVALLLVILGLILVKVLGAAGRLQDCAMSGRSNCAPIDTAPPER
jgi:hypothetical protein